VTAGQDGVRFAHAPLRECIERLFTSAGCDAEKASAIAEILLEADLMGHSTHGLALVPWYLESLASGDMRASGEPETVSDRGACTAWNGRRLPGTWLTRKAMDLALDRAQAYGTATVAIADSHHIGALVAYLPRAVERGCMAIVASSSPAVATVAPYGGMRAVMTPDPIAVGIPTAGAPILIDISASITTNNRARQLMAQGERFPRPWALDAQGRETDDPAAVLGGGGSLLPVGGLDHGHKGYALALVVEALTQGLGGHGRADAPKGSANSVFVQVIDPDAFAGRDAFARQTSWLADACRSNPPRPGVERVRVPGENALARRSTALREGVVLAPPIVAALRARAAQAGLELPAVVE
jgi:L-lactate dehydrogenase